MRKVLIFMMVTLDGFFEGPNGEIDWHNVDDEFNDFAIGQIHSVDTLVFGRRTYEMMASYWPTSAARTNDPIVAGLMNQTPKIVFSNTLSKVEWENTRLVKGDIARELARIKDQPGKDLIIFGSSNLAVTLARQGLIDEFRIMVNPVLLGGGHSLFEGLKLDLALMKTRSFTNGNVLLYYQPANK